MKPPDVTITISGVYHTPNWSTIETLLREMLDDKSRKRGQLNRIARKDGKSWLNSHGEYELGYLSSFNEDCTIKLVVR